MTGYSEVELFNKCNKLETENVKLEEQLYKAKEIISKLYSAGRDVLICLSELSEDIKQAEEFLKE